VKEEHQMENIDCEILETRKKLEKLPFWERVKIGSFIVGNIVILGSLCSMLFFPKVTLEMIKGFLYLTAAVVSAEIVIGAHADSIKVTTKQWQEKTGLISKLEQLECRKKRMERQVTKQHIVVPKKELEKSQLEVLKQIRSEMLDFKEQSLEEVKTKQKVRV